MYVIFSKLHWLLGRQSRFSIPNKVLLYKAIIKPIWCHVIQLGGFARTPNLEILETLQDLGIPMVKEEIFKYSTALSG